MTGIRNNHLKNIIRQYSKNKSGDLYVRLIQELDISNLIMAEIDNVKSNFLLLFSDIDEFNKYYPHKNDFASNDFDCYLNLVNEHGLDGILINNSFQIEADLLLSMPLRVKDGTDENEGLSGEKLLEIAQKSKNPSLEKLIAGGSPEFENLMLELKNSTLFNLIMTERDLGENEIIDLSNTGNYELFISEKYGFLFSSMEAINKFSENLDDEYYYYMQITSVDDYMEYVLKNDLEGIIITTATSDYLLKREWLLEAIGAISYNNPDYVKSFGYAFHF